MSYSHVEPLVSFSAEDRILVTGASSGIGAAIALCANALGASVIASGRDQEKLNAVKACASSQKRFHNEQLDLTADMEALPAWIRQLREKYGKLFAFAHAAGQSMTEPFAAYKLSKAQSLFDICFHVPLLLAQAFTDRRNCASNGGSIVFIAAAAAIAPNKGQCLYGAAKGALVSAARCMSKELASRRIRVNCISPGLVRTPMLTETIALLGDSFIHEEEPQYPLGLGEAQDIAGLTAFLLSNAGRWITGQNILMDGGRLG